MICPRCKGDIKGGYLEDLGYCPWCGFGISEQDLSEMDFDEFDGEDCPAK